MSRTSFSQSPLARSSESGRKSPNIRSIAPNFGFGCAQARLLPRRGAFHGDACPVSPPSPLCLLDLGNEPTKHQSLITCHVTLIVWQKLEVNFMNLKPSVKKVRLRSSRSHSSEFPVYLLNSTLSADHSTLSSFCCLSSPFFPPLSQQRSEGRGSRTAKRRHERVKAERSKREVGGKEVVISALGRCMDFCYS